MDIIAHPTGRLIGKREGADLDMEAILQAAAETGTAIEVNAYPDRLDLKDEHVRAALDAGAEGYLLKEEAAEELVPAITCLRQGRTYISSRISA